MSELTPQEIRAAKGNRPIRENGQAHKRRKPIVQIKKQSDPLLKPKASTDPAVNRTPVDKPTPGLIQFAKPKKIGLRK